jgi:glycerophosphoryl diester phosphodiesterase
MAGGFILADMLELDVHLTKDDVLIIMHDRAVDRTTDGTGIIDDMTFEEIERLNAGSPTAPERVPRFDEFIKWASEIGIMLNIEIKEYYSEENEERTVRCIEKVIELVEKHEMADKVVINSFDGWILEYVYKHYGKKYMLHGFYPYTIMRNVSTDPTEYLYCACIFDSLNKSLYDELIEKGIEPWIGASVTQKNKLEVCQSYGARLVTTNNTKDTISKLKEAGLR